MEITEMEWENVKNKIADLENKLKDQRELTSLLLLQAKQNDERCSDTLRIMKTISDKVIRLSKAIQKSFDEIIVESHL